MGVGPLDQTKPVNRPETMTTTEDSRRSKTRTALVSAFNSLFFEDPANEIRVADVIQKAQVGRSTFYEHFSGVEDLLMLALSQPMTILAESITGANNKDDLLWLLQHFKENQQRARKVLDGPRSRRVTRVLLQLLEQRLGTARPTTSMSKQLVLQHLAEGPLGMIKSWVSGEMWASDEELASAIIQTSRLSLNGLLDLSSCE